MAAKRKPGRSGTRIAEGDRLTVRINVRLQPATAAKLDEIADLDGKSRTDVLEEAIELRYAQLEARVESLPERARAMPPRGRHPKT